MQTKLTLRLDSRLIRSAKAYARRHRKSVSQVVADLFRRLERPDDSGPDLSPPVRSLVGALKGARVSEEDYRRYLAEKHR